MEHGIHFSRDENVVRYIMFIECEFWISYQVSNVFRAASNEIIQPNHVMTLSDQSVIEMGAQETGCACD
jgi:hypothetical protein